ncbi:hypothetical protein EJB05_26745, partial [Eragrostis curvula]
MMDGTPFPGIRNWDVTKGGKDLLSSKVVAVCPWRKGGEREVSFRNMKSEVMKIRLIIVKTMPEIPKPGFILQFLFLVIGDILFYAEKRKKVKRGTEERVVESKKPSRRKGSATAAGYEEEMEEREKVVCLAKLAEQAERYDDMVEYMKKLARMDVDMSAEERHLFSVGFKNTIGAKRASWRILSSLEQKVTAGDQTGVMIDAYKRKIEDELRMVCNEILSIIAIHCLPLATSGENAVFFYKMKGDYYRYLAEFSTGNEKKAAADQALMAYQHAMVVASSELSPAHQIRLGVALNFSVFFYEILNSHERAYQVAKQAFDEAAAEINSSGDGAYKDSTLMMQLLKDNLALWTSELTGGETSKDDDIDMEG